MTGDYTIREEARVIIHRVRGPAPGRDVGYN